MAMACQCAMADSPQPTGARLWTRADLQSLDRALSSEMKGTGAAYTQVVEPKGEVLRTVIIKTR
jgi:hypothetical protein